MSSKYVCTCMCMCMCMCNMSCMPMFMCIFMSPALPDKLEHALWRQQLQGPAPLEAAAEQRRPQLEPPVYIAVCDRCEPRCEPASWSEAWGVVMARNVWHRMRVDPTILVLGVSCAMLYIYLQTWVRSSIYLPRHVK